MHSLIAAKLRSRADQLLQGRIDALLDGYIFPLPVFTPDRRMLLSSPEQATVVLTLLRNRLLRSGVVALQPQVRAVELPRAGRFRIWVDWQERIMPADETRLSTAIYYLRVTDLGPRIEMVNYTHLSTPELSEEFEALALSA